MVARVCFALAIVTVIIAATSAQAGARAALVIGNATSRSLPTPAHPANNAQRTAVDLTAVLRPPAARKPGHLLALVDAPRDNPFAAGPFPADALTIGGDMLVAFSTRSGGGVVDGPGRNGPYAAALLRHLPTGGLDMRRMVARVRAAVVEATSGQQIPWETSALTGDVYLATPGSAE